MSLARVATLTGITAAGLLAADVVYLVWPTQRKRTALVEAIAWAQSRVEDIAEVIEQKLEET